FYRRKLAPGTTLSFGVDVQTRSHVARRRGSLNLPAREGDIVVFGQRPSGETTSDHWNLLLIDTAPFATAEISLGRLTLPPGLRFEPTLISGDPVRPRNPNEAPRGYERLDIPFNPVPSPLRYAPNPRLVATFKATKRLALTAGGGVYGQPPDVEDMSP